MNNPWQLYDDLIDLIPPGTKVRDARIGNWACVTSDAGTGVAMIYRGGPGPVSPNAAWSAATSRTPRLS